MTLSNEILDAHLKVGQLASQHFRQYFSKLDLTFPQAMVLNALLDTAPIPISMLAERTGSANSTVSGIVDRLEKLGLVVRERSEEDRRVIYVNLTDACRETQKMTAADVRGYFAQLLDKLTPEEKTAIRDGLRLLQSALDVDPEKEG